MKIGLFLKELRVQSRADLTKRLDRLRLERYKLLSERNVSKRSKTPHILKENRRKTARVLTVMREKEG